MVKYFCTYNLVIVVQGIVMVKLYQYSKIFHKGTNTVNTNGAITSKYEY